MTNTVFDIKSTNNDFLNLSLSQYNKSLTDRRDAWIDSTHLPIGVKRELKMGDHVSPQLTDEADTRLSMLGQQEVRALEEHHQILRDQIMFKSLQGPQGFRPKNQGENISIREVTKVEVTRVTKEIVTRITRALVTRTLAEAEVVVTTGAI